MSDNAEIQRLRQELKDLEAQLKAGPTREQVEADVRAEMEREKLAQILFAERSHPAGLAKRFLSDMGSDGDVDDTSVDEWLEGLGYDTSAPLLPAPTEPQVPVQHQELADVTSLSARVNAAAVNINTDAIATKIAKADSMDDLVRIAREGGFAE